MHVERVTKLLIITSKHMQHCGLPLLRMPREIKVSIITNAAAYPHPFMFSINALGQSDQGVSVVVKVSHPLYSIGNMACIVVKMIYFINYCCIGHSLDTYLIHILDFSCVCYCVLWTTCALMLCAKLIDVRRFSCIRMPGPIKRAGIYTIGH